MRICENGYCWGKKVDEDEKIESEPIRFSRLLRCCERENENFEREYFHFGRADQNCSGMHVWFEFNLVSKFEEIIRFL